MRLKDFEAMIRRMADEIPPEYYDGVAEVTVSPKTLPHPVRPEIYTLGECIPIPVGDGDLSTVQSRIVLYHGSFQALADITPEFDWREESWETLTHELRHHLEWRARVPDLEAFDDAAEENFARHDGEAFDPLFHLDGERVAPGIFKVEDDYFLDREVGDIPSPVTLEWHGARYAFDAPPDTTLPAFLIVDGVEEPPPGDLVVVLRRKAGLLGFLRTLRAGGEVFQAVVEAAPDERNVT